MWKILKTDAEIYVMEKEFFKSDVFFQGYKLFFLKNLYTNNVNWEKMPRWDRYRRDHVGDLMFLRSN